MTPRRANTQQDLFEAGDPPIELSRDQKQRLLPLLQTMLSEIVTPTSKEAGDDEGEF